MRGRREITARSLKVNFRPPILLPLQEAQTRYIPPPAFVHAVAVAQGPLFRRHGSNNTAAIQITYLQMLAGRTRRPAKVSPLLCISVIGLLFSLTSLLNARLPDRKTCQQKCSSLNVETDGRVWMRLRLRVCWRRDRYMCVCKRNSVRACVREYLCVTMCV